MNIVSIILTILGLSLFEIISSVDNAIINAEVLSTMDKKPRKWFLSWGLLFAVFVIRGLLPFLLKKSARESGPILLIGGGIFLIFLFFHWLFMEDKNFGLPGERFFRKQSVWFYGTVSVMLTAVVWLALQINPVMAFSAVVGSTAFFILHGFRQTAEQEEKNMLNKIRSDISKILYLEVIDATFSIDGVLGAFAFTLSVPLILIGNGLGALILRELTVRNIDTIKKYLYIKNGAMYSILFLGIIMLADSFGVHVPEWLSPIITFIIVGYFFVRSKKVLS